MTDFEKFIEALFVCQPKEQHSKEEKIELNHKLFEKIKDLNCNDFRFFYNLALYHNSYGSLQEARINIDKSIQLLPFINYKASPIPLKENNRRIVYKNAAYSIGNLGEIFYCAGEIYGRLGIQNESLKYYKKSHYHKSFLKSEFEKENKVTLFSFRKYNEYTLSDLINNTITVCSPKKMNDPFDSLINLWGSENNLKEICTDKMHIYPFSKSFDYFRIRCFSKSTGNTAIKNILMWSHYAGEHTGFCIKYKLSKHFIKQEENDNDEHMYLKKIIYKDEKIDLHIHSINTDLAFATKKKCWKYEDEVRLIAFNPNIEGDFQSIELDESSEIEAIFFGYKCSDLVINTIKNIFIQKKGIRMPKFYKMDLDINNVYKMKYHKI